MNLHEVRRLAGTLQSMGFGLVMMIAGSAAALLYAPNWAKWAVVAAWAVYIVYLKLAT